MSSMASACKYFDVCGLPGVLTTGGSDMFCILHYPETAQKDIADFRHALDRHLSAGRSSFRNFHFPDAIPDIDLTGRTFTSDVYFTDVVFVRTLILENATFEKDLSIALSDIQMASLRGAGVKGHFRVTATNVSRIDLAQARFEGPVNVEVSGGIYIEARQACFAGHVSLHASNVSGMYLSHARFWKGLKLHAICQADRDLSNTSFAGLLDWPACTFNGDLHLADTIFQPDSILNLNNSTIRGQLLLTGASSNLPCEIYLNGTACESDVKVEAPIRSPQTRLIADKSAPHFSGHVSLANVDLSTCRLLGNVLERLEFSNITWAQRVRRCVLYDELCLRRGDATPLGNLKEAYQGLKLNYQKTGDNRRAGDFHYGEMEIQRRQYGWPWRLVSLEGLYWALNGYGIGHIRAFVILLGIVAGFGFLFWLTDRDAFAHRSFLEALRYSVSVATLQRPEIPWTFGQPGKWLHALEAMLGPIQIALFVLALRMRMKR